MTGSSNGNGVSGPGGDISSGSPSNDISKAKSPSPNPNRSQRSHWSTRQLALMGIFTAIGAAFSFIPIPLWPPAGAFGITYDPAAVPAAIGTLSMGTGPGATIGILSILIHWMLTGDTVGIIINIISIVSFVVPLGLIYRRRKTNARLIVGLLVGSCLSTLIMVPTNLIVWPYFFGMPFEDVVPYMVPMILPFNILKSLLNSILVFGLYQSLHKLIER